MNALADAILFNEASPDFESWGILSIPDCPLLIPLGLAAMLAHLSQTPAYGANRIECRPLLQTDVTPKNSMSQELLEYVEPVVSTPCWS